METNAKNNPIFQIIDENQKKGVFPGSVLCASSQGMIRFEYASGVSTLLPEPIPIMRNAFFDIASLTKPVATTTAIMSLVDAGELEIDLPVSHYLDSFHPVDKRNITIRDLLCHRSGLPAHVEYYKMLEQERQNGNNIPLGSESVAWVVDKISKTPLDSFRKKAVYSDLGFIVLGHLVEVITSQSFEYFCEKEIFQPMGMLNTFFLPLFDDEEKKHKLRGKQMVATENCPWRGRVLQGEVHDENCWAMGGVAGHAGLFSTSNDLHLFCQRMLRCYHDADSFFSSNLVRNFWEQEKGIEGSTWALGWDTPSLKQSSAGILFSPLSVGHLGYTGCSLWIDPTEDIIVVFLSNRVHPSRENEEIKKFRPLLHNTLHSLLTTPAPLPPPVEMGQAPEILQVQDISSLSIHQATHSRLRPPPAMRSAFPLSGEQSFDSLDAASIPVINLDLTRETGRFSMSPMEIPSFDNEEELELFRKKTPSSPEKKEKP